FSTKAGILPMGDWLPDAHPAAPSGVSAILSGVMIKLGAYGVLRVFWGTLPYVGIRSEALSWGVIIAFLGTISAFVGGITAMRENDSKRLLAFSSISQTGYIFLALGIAVAFSRSEGLESLAALALLGAGFHILNDAVYKSLLFMNAGSILYSTGTRDLNRVGGLASVMPMVAAAGLVGVASLSGLPLTNGFASKWLIYQSSISGSLKFAPFVVVAVTAFFVSLSTLAYSLKYYNTAFLGKAAAGSHEPARIPASMTATQCFLALVCIAIGLAPAWALRLIASVFQASSADILRTGRAGGLSAIPASGLAPAAWSPVLMLSIFIGCLVVVLAIRRSGSAKTRAVPNWYGGEEYADDEVRFRAQRAGGNLTDKISRSHQGIPQLYMIWQVIGMIVVLATLILLVR
ncbi:MAG: proton-conducting transporter membrane subunit, partial [Armatimonadetes bacterium]|nr:proton-conducting transporter membrane subunit [Armatimonadota bacterium]